MPILLHIFLPLYSLVLREKSLYQVVRLTIGIAYICQLSIKFFVFCQFLVRIVAMDQLSVTPVVQNPVQYRFVFASRPRNWLFACMTNITFLYKPMKRVSGQFSDLFTGCYCLRAYMDRLLQIALTGGYIAEALLIISTSLALQQHLILGRCLN